MNRRSFVKKTSIAAAGASLIPSATWANPSINSLPDNWVWFNGSNRITEDRWRLLLERISTSGFNGVACNGGNDFYKNFAPLCAEYNVQLHTWRWTVNRGHYAQEHPEWYAVNRNGDSVLDKPPYVGYYRWLCPSRPEVRRLIKEDYVELAKIKGVSGVHLDYVRYCDVYLPIGLQPKYNLVQDHEMPEFDYCYCSTCRGIFEDKHGYDPMSKADPSKDEQWHQFRLDQLVDLVNEIVDGVHQAGSLISGAVFPTPEMSRQMVRQDWARFNLDAYLPMLYHDAYLEDTHWISRGIAEARKEVPSTPIYAGMLFGKAFPPELLVDTYKRVRDAGGNGISVFTGWSLSDDQLKAFATLK